MINAIDLAAAEKAEFVGNLGQMFPIHRHISPAFAAATKLKRTLDVIAFAAFHRGFEHPLADEFLEVQLLQGGLGVKGIDMARPPLHHQENATLGLRRGMASFGGERPDLLLGQQGSQGHAAEAGPQTEDEIATRRRVQGA
jgi:hypothetical protein